MQEYSGHTNERSYNAQHHHHHHHPQQPQLNHNDPRQHHGQPHLQPAHPAQQSHQHPPFETPPHKQSAQNSNDSVDRLLRQAEISRLTRTLKSKLALASMKTQKSPSSTPRSEPRRRTKTLEGALPSPRPSDPTLATAQRTPKPMSRRSSVNSISSQSSFGSSSSLASPRARIPRISSVSSIFETNFEGFDEPDSSSSSLTLAARTSPIQQVTPQTSPYQSSIGPRSAAKPPVVQVHDEEPLPKEPQTPPSVKRSFPKTPERSSTSDGANLLLHFAHSPGRATPRTPDFNMSDYLHFQTPSPARGQLTPRHMRWGSLNSALFQPAGPVMMPRPAGSGFTDE